MPPAPPRDSSSPLTRDPTDGCFRGLATTNFQPLESMVSRGSLDYIILFVPLYSNAYHRPTDPGFGISGPRSLRDNGKSMDAHAPGRPAAGAPCPRCLSWAAASIHRATVVTKFPQRYLGWIGPSRAGGRRRLSREGADQLIEFILVGLKVAGGRHRARVANDALGLDQVAFGGAPDPSDESLAEGMG